MKKVLGLLFFAYVFTINTFSQINKLDKFEGTWQWKSNDSVFTVILKKVDFNGKKFDEQMPDSTVDLMIGWYELKVKDKIIKSNLGNVRNTFDYDKRQPLMGNSVDEITNTLILRINITKPILFQISNGGNKALWEFVNMPVDLPKKAILTRKK